ncbi:MAG: hypothetical protein J6T15_03625 [Bacilli bacterium]|nr:hypothetical protein [Bacilli bacterium]
MRIRELEKVVDMVLETDPSTRSDDFFLINEVYKSLGVDTNNNMAFLLRNHLFYKLPSFESVTRARRKVLEKKPYLRENNEKRKELELEFREYSRT